MNKVVASIFTSVACLGIGYNIGRHLPIGESNNTLKQFYQGWKDSTGEILRPQPLVRSSAEVYWIDYFAHPKEIRERKAGEQDVTLELEEYSGIPYSDMRGRYIREGTQKIKRAVVSKRFANRMEVKELRDKIMPDLISRVPDGTVFEVEDE
jgi:hypothetical protein